MTQPMVDAPGGERIDRLVSTIRARAWLTVLALLLVAGAAAAWAVGGQVRSVIQIAGVVVTGDGPVAVPAPGAGSLAQTLVRKGGEVSAGSPLAVLADEKGTRRTVTSPVSGHVSRIAAPGTPVLAGTAVAAIDTGSGPPRALLLAGPEQAGALTPGQPARVALPGAFLSGRVSEVGAYPVTDEDLRHRFGDVLAAAGTRHLVTVDLHDVRDAVGLSRAQAEITVAVVRPIDALLGGGGLV
ncbi:Biotin-requiring enzyme [Nonomuraea maritima]|uniref:Biotin-requiring enzyme n=1 Tax=Nonomuraea maritima TaxID=683260 RepID=A0A1G9HJW9_9ACTN|nr:biotin/lipoyl-containing protein [Nonomuraea maritima]SDL13162.1 Biotin-requiring enzyme [Nonomuraea maritima]